MTFTSLWLEMSDNNRLPTWSFAFVLVTIVFLMSLSIPVRAESPNVLLILTDDQGYGDLSIHGNPSLATPSIDRLAEDGIRFDRFYVNSFCAPTRAALLTGRYPLRCGVWGVTHSKETMRASEVTIAEALRSAGYRTACIGKWHNGEQYPYTATGQGFDEFFGFHNGHINDYFDAALIRGSTPEATHGYLPDVLTDDAIRFMKAHENRPFFCFVSYNTPHSPYQVADRYYDKFRSMGFDERLAAFYGMCENIDDNVGRLLETIDGLELTDETIVIFLTDNGGTAGVPEYNAGMRGGKTSVHEGGCRVPLFVRWTNHLPTNAIVPQLTSHIDLYPTLLELCGVKPPDGPPVDGVSLVPLMKGQEVDWTKRTIFTHNPISTTNRYPGAVRTEQYRLVRTIRGPQGGSSAREDDKSAPAWMLFDMHADPGERIDIAADHPEIVRNLGQQYEQWLDEITANGLERFPIPIGYAEENPVTLNAPQSYPTGSLAFDHGPGFAHDWLTNWTSVEAEIRFDLEVVRSGEYEVTLIYGCDSANAGSPIDLTIAGQRLESDLPAAVAPEIPLQHRDDRSFTRYVDREWGTHVMGRVDLEPGRVDLTLRASGCVGDSVMDFKGIRMRRLDNE